MPAMIKTHLLTWRGRAKYGANVGLLNASIKAVRQTHARLGLTPPLDAYDGMATKLQAANAALSVGMLTTKVVAGCSALMEAGSDISSAKDSKAVVDLGVEGMPATLVQKLNDVAATHVEVTPTKRRKVADPM